MSGWQLSYDHYDPDREMLREVLCATGNGNFVTRAASPDSHHDGTHYPGTYLAGGYNRAVTEIQGRPVENEDLVNLPNWLPLSFRIDGDEWFAVDGVEILDYWQVMDVWSGLLTRDLRFRDPAGRITRWRERRLVSMADPHLAALEVQLTAENWSGELTLRTALDGTVTNNGVARYRELEGNHLEVLDTAQPDPEIVTLLARTRQSRLEVAEAARTRLYRQSGVGDPPLRRDCQHREGWIGEDLHTTLNEGETLTVEKTVALYASRDPGISEAGLAAREVVARAGRFEALFADHQIAWENLWENGDIVIRTRNGEQANLKLRVHLFHLFQTLSPHTAERDIGGPARGWHGEAYRGHIFWDELFIFPYLNLRQSLLTRGLLRYRHRRLSAARRAAREAGFEGAMFPWQSGSDGREESQQLHLNLESGRWIPDNTHRQRHVNAAIAYNIWHYIQATDDLAFLAEYGAEMLVEIARFWASIACYNEAQCRYEIHHVMGPDEYHTAYPDADRDLRDIQGGTTHEGIHLGAMASTVDLAQRCFTGLESRAGVLHFNPVLPEEVESLTVWLRYHSHSLEVNIDQERLVLECHRHSAGSPITVAYRGHARRLAPGDRYSFRLIRAVERDRDESRHCRAESRREIPEHRNL